MKHIVDLEQIMHSNDVEHNFIGTIFTRIVPVEHICLGTKLIQNKL